MFEINDSLSAENILNDDSLRFFEKFITSFEERRKELLEKRNKTQEFISNGGRFSFPEDTSIRDSEWTVVPPPQDLSLIHI